ncbi:MAG: hypothetical protein IJI04_02140 [Lachnospiraceae bacterium]|nr:hypothetical protein [Lachnospiraceae bacterium]
METLNSFDISMFQPSTGTFVFGIVVAVLTVVILYKIFEKAGVEGWKAFIPLYNIFVLYELTWGNGFVSLLLLVPIVDIVISVMTAIKLAKAFGKGTGFGIGIFFFPVICKGIIAFDESRYEGVPA